METILIQSLGIVLPSVASLLLSVLAFAANEVRKKVKQEQIRTALTILVNITESVVQSLNKTTVPALREKARDGMLSAQDKIEVKRLALETIKAELPNAVITILTKANVAVDSRINTEIESQVLLAKQDGIVD